MELKKDGLPPVVRPVLPPRRTDWTVQNTAYGSRHTPRMPWTGVPAVPAGLAGRLGALPEIVRRGCSSSCTIVGVGIFVYCVVPISIVHTTCAPGGDTYTHARSRYTVPMIRVLSMPYRAYNRQIEVILPTVGRCLLPVTRGDCWWFPIMVSSQISTIQIY